MCDTNQHHLAFPSRERVNSPVPSWQEGLAARQSTSEAVLVHLIAEEEAAAKRLEQQRLELELIRSQERGSSIS